MDTLRDLWARLRSFIPGQADRPPPASQPRYRFVEPEPRIPEQPSQAVVEVPEPEVSPEAPEPETEQTQSEEAGPMQEHPAAAAVEAPPHEAGPEGADAVTAEAPAEEPAPIPVQAMADAELTIDEPEVAAGTEPEPEAKSEPAEPAARKLRKKRTRPKA